MSHSKSEAVKIVIFCHALRAGMRHSPVQDQIRLVFERGAAQQIGARLDRSFAQPLILHAVRQLTSFGDIGMAKESPANNPPSGDEASFQLRTLAISSPLLLVRPAIC